MASVHHDRRGPEHEAPVQRSFHIGARQPVTTAVRYPVASRPAGPKSRHLAFRFRVILRSVFRKTPLRSRSVMICESCELTGGPFAPGEAAHLLEIHQQLHHGAVARHRSSLPPRP